MFKSSRENLVRMRLLRWFSVCAELPIPKRSVSAQAHEELTETKQKATAVVKLGVNVLSVVVIEVKMMIGVVGRAIEKAAKVAHEVAVVDALGGDEEGCGE